MGEARRVREERRAAESPPVTATAVATLAAPVPVSEPVIAPAPVVEAAPLASGPANTELTGGDLARWRATARLAQRPAAAKLGVAPSTVAKAELTQEKRLGDVLAAALTKALREAGEALR